MTPSPRAQEEARRRPNGHVFEFDEKFEPNGKVPHDRVKGAWRVDGEGRIVGEFIPNPYYRAKTEPLDGWEFWLE
ncbi:MAG TPA: hypothetical protein VI454_05065 [Verrucomicrobiae bacterium]|jgi:hypothetical protein